MFHPATQPRTYAAARRAARALATDPAYAIPTRAAGERRAAHWPNDGRRALVYLDLDYLHDANAIYGHEGVDSRVRAALHCRAADCIKWWGDEIVAVCPRYDALALAGRLRRALRAVDLAATFAVVPYTGDLAGSVAAAAALVEAAKARQQRGHIYWSADFDAGEE